MRNAMWVGGGITGMGEIPMLGVKEKGIAKVIRDIFRNGEQGFFYEPSDMGTLYQDSAGTTAVNATGQPVGLILDKSRGVVFGRELNSNPTFNTDLSGWSTGSTSSAVFDNGEAKVTLGGTIGGTSNNWFKLDGSYHLGKWYTVSFDATYISGGNLQAGFGYAVGLAVLSSQNGGTKQTYSFTSKGNFSTEDALLVFGTTSAGSVWKIDNVSVKEVLGNHAYQSTSASRPILQQTPILGSELLANGSFDAGSAGWTTTSGGWAFEGGAASPDGLTSNRSLYPSPTVTSIGKAYIISMVVRSKGTQGSIWVSFSDGAGISNKWEFKDIENGSVLSHSGTISGNSQLYIKTTDGWDGSLESVSIKEIIGYRTDQNHIKYDAVDDKLITNLPSALTNCTVLRAIPNVGTQVKYNQTLPMLYEDSSNHSGLVAIDRALTRKEQLRLMNELDKKAGATSLETLTFKAFDNNQEGFVYDPNDLSTLFQDSAGIVPVTSIGQPVGLMLDKSKGLVLGGELNSNNFNTNLASWAVGSASSVILENGEAKVTLGGAISSTANNWFKLAGNYDLGKRYTVSFDATHVSGGDLHAGFGYTVGLTVTAAQNGATKQRYTFTSSGNSATGSGLLAFGASTAGSVWKIDNVSVKEVVGNHAFQATSASRPILRKNAVTGANYLEFDNTDDHLQVGGVGLPSPMSAMFAVDNSTSIYSVLLSSGAAGYLSLSSTGVGFHESGGIATRLTRNVPKDVVTVNFSNSNVNMKTARGETTFSFGNSFSGSSTKYIGMFSPTGNAKFGGNMYGIVVITKELTTAEESSLRQLFNKRMGI